MGMRVTLTHDDIISDYVELNGSSVISGNVHIGECADIGIDTEVVPGIRICANAVTGAGTVVVKNIEQPGTYVGVPAKLIKNHN